MDIMVICVDLYIMRACVCEVLVQHIVDIVDVIEVTGIIDTADIVDPCIDLCLDITVMYMDLCIVCVCVCVVDFCLDIIHSVDSMENGRNYRHVIDTDMIEIEDIEKWKYKKQTCHSLVPLVGSQPKSSSRSFAMQKSSA